MTLTEEQQGAVAFDLGKAREAVHTLENFAFASGKITAGQIQDVLWGARLLATSAAEIERLRAENAWLKSDREFQSEEQAARIKELEDALKEEKAWTSQYQKWLLLFSHLCDAVILQIAGHANGQGSHIFTVVGANVTGNCLNWTIEGGI